MIEMIKEHNEYEVNTYDDYVNTKIKLQGYLLDLYCKKNVWNKPKIFEIHDLVLKEGWLSDRYKVDLVLKFMRQDEKYKGVDVNMMIESFNRFGENLYRERVRLERRKEREKLKILKEQENCSNLEDFM